jgi:formate hydrogenlyase subunit 4
VNTAGVLGAIGQVVVTIAGAPLLVGLMRQVRARLEGRAGAGVGQPCRDLRKLAGKEAISPAGTGPVFRAAPAVLLGTGVVTAAVVPSASLVGPLDSGVDLFAVVALLALGTAALALAGLDTGTAFGGLGASRGITVLALVEPTILLAVFALSVPVGTTNLATIVAAARRSPTHQLAPVSLLAAVALGVVIIAETGRLPVDNPSTHLELTMIHEAMVLEYAGPDLAVVELAGAVRLAVLLGLFATLFAPWGLTSGLVGLPVALLLLVGKVAVLGALLAAGEVFAAKVRLFRVPELLAGSFLLALLAVAGSYFLTAGGPP